MPIYRIQHCFQGRSGAAEDKYCNTFHFACGSTLVDGVVTDLIESYVFDFYNGFMDDYGSDDVGGLGSTVKTYNLADPIPRTPVSEYIAGGTRLTAGPASLALPSEVALCLSYEAVAVAGTNRARRRGRVYLGPFASTALADTPDRSRPHATLVTQIITAWGLFVENMLALTPSCSLGVYSPTDGLHLPAAHAWVDNAWDTQRRRGQDPSNREEWFAP